MKMLVGGGHTCQNWKNESEKIIFIPILIEDFDKFWGNIFGPGNARPFGLYLFQMDAH